MRKAILRASSILLLSTIILGAASCSKDSVTPSPSALLLLQEKGNNSISLASVNLTTGAITKKGTVADLTSWPDKNIMFDDVVYISGTPSDTKLRRVYRYNLKDDKVSYNDVSQTMTMAGSYNGSIVVLWWDDKQEKFGLFDTSNGSVKELGIVGDLCWWYVQCFVKDNNVYSFGMMADQKENILYKCDMKTGKLAGKFTVSANYTFAGFYNNSCIVLSWDGKQIAIGSLNLASGAETKMGAIADVKSWSMQCTISDDMLYVLAESKSATGLSIYGYSLKDGKLLSTTSTNISSAIFVKKSI
jgi:hypothetical protein